MITFFCEGCESKKHKIPDMYARAYARAGQSDGHNIGQNLVAPLGLHGIRTNTRMKTRGMFFVIAPFHLLHRFFANST